MGLYKKKFELLIYKFNFEFLNFDFFKKLLNLQQTLNYKLLHFLFNVNQLVLTPILHDNNYYQRYF